MNLGRTVPGLSTHCNRFGPVANHGAEFGSSGGTVKSAATTEIFADGRFHSKKITPPPMRSHPKMNRHHKK